MWLSLPTFVAFIYHKLGLKCDLLYVAQLLQMTVDPILLNPILLYKQSLTTAKSFTPLIFVDDAQNHKL